DEIGDELVHGGHAGCPRALRGAHGGALVHLAFLTDDLPDANELARHVLVHADDVVEQLPRAAHDAVLVVRNAHAEVALLHELEHLDEALDLAAARARQPVPLARSALVRGRGDHAVAVARAL